MKKNTKDAGLDDDGGNILQRDEEQLRLNTFTRQNEIK